MPALRPVLTRCRDKSEDAQHRATEFLKELYASGRIDEGRLDTGVAQLLAAGTDAEVAEVATSRPGSALGPGAAAGPSPSLTVGPARPGACPPSGPR